MLCLQRYCYIIVLMFICAVNLSCAKNSQTTLNSALQTLPNGTAVGFLAETVEAKPRILVQHNASIFRAPASTEKLVTALAAVLELGNDFRFDTQILSHNKIRNHQINGNVIFKMSGDPSFTSSALDSMLNTLKSKGLKKINGNIIIDSSIFAGHDRGMGWAWNNLTACYNSPPSAIIIDGNCFYVSVMPNKKVGGQAKLELAKKEPITMSINVKTIDPSSNNISEKYCDLDVNYDSLNRYRLGGCINASSQKSTYKFSVLDSTEYFAKKVRQALAKHNIQLTGKITETKQSTASNKNLIVLTNHQSEPLSVLLIEMMKNSNNMYADTLFRTIGAHYYNMSGTWNNSSDAIKAILKQKANIDLKNVYIVDGSGLSRQNAISPELMMSVLQYIALNDKELNLIAKLPVSGVDGTLAYRVSVNTAPLKNNIHAKTGSLDGTYNMAGFIQKKNGRYIAFVQFVSGFHPLDSSLSNKKEAIMSFENKMYTQLIR